MTSHPLDTVRRRLMMQARSRFCARAPIGFMTF